MEQYLPSFKCGNPLAKTTFPSSPSHWLFPPSPKPKLGVTNSFSNQAYWASINADVKTHLRKAIPVRPPISVFEPMHRLTFAAPETTAPALCIAACELVGGHRDQAMAAASALQLVHAATYAHEKLLSGGRPGSNGSLIYNPNIELLTPDGMIPFGLELLAASSNDPALVMRAIIEVTRAAGSQGTVQGKYNELQYGSPPNGDDQSIKMEIWVSRVCKKKEGSLHACAGACGAILGGGSEEEIEKLRMFGLYAGTIQGIDNSVEINQGNRLVKELRDLALIQLQGFDQEKVSDIAGLIAELEPREAALVC